MIEKIIVIAGAGIAGLTSALALAKYGVKSIVLERNEEIQEFGAGLQLGPNAHRALIEIGLEEALESVSFEPEGVDIFSFGHEKPLVTLKLGKTARKNFGVPYTVIHRADMVETLYAACKKSDLIKVIFNVQDFDILNFENTPTVNFTLANGEKQVISCFAFIGADGVGSITRTKFLNGPQAKFSGYVAWRTLIAEEELQDVLNLKNTSLMWGSGFHGVAYPLTHRKIVNVAYFTKETMSIGFGIREKPNLPISTNSDKRLAKICSLTKQWTHWPLAAVNTKTWHNGAVGLVGDAAHAMLPFQAQGAAMGIEDSLILAPLLVSEKSAATAFSKYQNIRQQRVTKVANTSQANGKIFHMKAPLTFARNSVVKMQGSMNHYKRLGWIYDYDPVNNI